MSFGEAQERADARQGPASSRRGGGGVTCISGKEAALDPGQKAR